jgi:acyl carrier protein
MISEVGYLHENPDIESILLRKGIQQINESEMLSIIDISLSQSMEIANPYDIAAEAHILTGLEPFGLLELRKKGFNVSNPAMSASRTSILARALEGHDEVAATREGELPAGVVKAMESGLTLTDAITACIAKRFGDLVLLSANKVSLEKPLDEYGMDSMIAAEFRSWFFQSFKVDVPFLELLGKTTTVSSLSKVVLKEVKARQ